MQVKFTVKDGQKFDDAQVIAALKQKGSKYSTGAKKLVGPTEGKKDETKTN